MMSAHTRNGWPRRRLHTFEEQCTIRNRAFLRSHWVWIRIPRLAPHMWSHAAASIRRLGTARVERAARAAVEHVAAAVGNSAALGARVAAGSWSAKARAAPVGTIAAPGLVRGARTAHDDVVASVEESSAVR